jgi:hypothetical protein
VNEPVDANGVIRKHVGPAEFAPIRMSCGIGMNNSVYQWLAEFLNRGRTTKDGAIVFCDYNFKEQSRLQFNNALITELAFPALDASAKDVATLTFTIQPERTRFSKTSSGANVPGFGAQTPNKWLSSNFQLRIDEAETAYGRVNKIDAIVVKQPPPTGLGLTAPPLEIPNIIFTLLANDAKEVSDWFEDFVLKGNNGPDKERGGRLQFLDISKKTALFSLKLSNLGIVRIGQERSEDHARVTGRVPVELYCEQMELSNAKEATGSAVPKKDSPADDNNTKDMNKSLAEALLRIMGGRIRTEELTNSTDTAQSELIARRLVETARPVVVGPSIPQRDDGMSIGKRWATEKATLDELQQVAALESGEWTAIKLESEHSLIAQLSEAGVIPPGGDGPLDLDRDEFVEGIVAGAARVLRSAAPQLSVLLKKIGDTAEGITENLK